MVRVGRIETVSCLLLLVAPLAAEAQRTSMVQLLSSDWRLTASAKPDLGEIRLWGGDLAIEREYGVKSLELRTYQLVDKTVQVLLETTPDPTSAYGLMTYYQSESGEPIKGFEMAVQGPSGVLMARGPLFIRVRAKASSISDPRLRSLLMLV